ncbi:aldehyde dehydrogenase family protein [Mycolicibacterium austroafricanum]|uniref:aldehyde dehydrogenase family protein n=1 Tax=Mycolicibacterium austroafricanum TaxID=39687 RepID=UPI000565B895|nr:aldehyde dehydrogenase family protein [Mycolicibacterium austroafricanum]
MGKDIPNARMPVYNPVNGVVVGWVPTTDPSDVGDLVERARRAQSQWQLSGFRSRAKALRELRKWIVDNRARLIAAVCAEGGKTYEDALLEILYVCKAIGFWAGHAEGYLREERQWSRELLLAGRRVVSRYEPRGVVGVIAPWNYPLVLGLGDALPALMAGNAVILKPSEVTPLASTMIVEEGMAAAGVPTGVCQVANGSGDVGQALVDNVDMIQFTGSTETGRAVAVRAAQRLIPASLEMGGNDAMIVLADADLERAANVAVYAGMCNAGQTCMSVERIYVEESVYAAFLELVEARVKDLRVGGPGAAGTVDIGSLTGPGQVDIVERHVQEAVQDGARVLVGGHRGKDGNFFQPTLLADVDHTMALMREETFGPVLPIVKVRNADEAITLANDSDFGLNSSVFTRDVNQGEFIARRLEAGSSVVNDACANFLDARAPFGGWKQSGLGGRNGVEGIRKYCRQQTILVTRFAMKREAYMFPYRRRTTYLMERLLALFFGRGG